MIKKLIFGIAINGGALWGVVYLFADKITYTGGILFFVIGGLMMGIINSIIKPILRVVTLPLRILTLGLSFILLNAFLFWLFEESLKAVAISDVSLAVNGIATYFLAGLMFGIINWVLHLFIRI